MRKHFQMVLAHSSAHPALPAIIHVRFFYFPVKLVMLEAWGTHYPKVLLSVCPLCRGRTHWLVSLFGSEATWNSPSIATHEGPPWVNSHKWSLNPIPLFSGGDQTSTRQEVLGVSWPLIHGHFLFPSPTLGSCGYLDTSAPLFLSPPLVKNLPAMQETWAQSLGWEDPLERGKASHSSILAWRIPWTV